MTFYRLQILLSYDRLNWFTIVSFFIDKQFVLEKGPYLLNMVKWLHMGPHQAFQGPPSYGVRTFFSRSICELFLSFLSPSSNWLGQVMWHKNYWWHHSALSTRPHSSTSLVTSVKVSFHRPKPPEVSFEYYTWFWLTQLNYKWFWPRTP